MFEGVSSYWRVVEGVGSYWRVVEGGSSNWRVVPIYNKIKMLKLYNRLHACTSHVLIV